MASESQPRRSPGLYAALSLFLVAVAVAAILFQQLSESSAWVMHTYEVMNELDDSIADLLDIESGARGYLLTESQSFLPQLRGASRRALAHVDRVLALTSDNPDQQNMGRKLKELAVERIAASEEILTVAVGQDRAALLKERVMKGKDLMDAFRKDKDQMAESEQRLLARRENAMIAKRRALGVCIALLSMLSMIAAGLSFRTVEQRSGVLERLNTQLRLKEEETRDLFENAPCGYHSVDVDGKFLKMNVTELSWLGYTREEVIDKLYFSDILDESSKQTFLSNFPRFKTEGSIRDVEFNFKRKDGSTFPVILNSTVVYDEDKTFLRSRSTVFDMTERKHLENMLKEKNEELERANLAKDKFLASMSHELRTPLNSILGFSGILLMDLSGPLNEEQRKQVNFVQSSGKHLLSLINDILDLAKIESGNVVLTLQPTHLVQVVNEVVATLKPFADAKGLQLMVNAYDGSDLVMVDPRSLSQITINLINNALKFTDTGSITVDINNDAEHLRMSVTDTGIGISPDDQEKLFKGFVQIPNSNRTDEGTGLGLHLSEKLARLMNGHIEMQSELNKGSCFTLVLPVTEV